VSDFVTTAALARELSINRRTLSRWVKEGIGPSPRVFNRRIYFDRDEVDSWKKSAWYPRGNKKSVLHEKPANT
jgi:excisionase family DNA binding protein